MANAQPATIVRAKLNLVKPMLSGTTVVARAVPIATGCTPAKEGSIIKSIIDAINSPGYWTSSQELI